MIEDVFELMKCFTGSFINQDEELILVPKRNIFFQLKDVNCRTDLVYKLLAYCSYECINNKRSLDSLNKFLGKSFNKENMMFIHHRIGNGINKDLAYEFIDNDLKLIILCYY